MGREYLARIGLKAGTSEPARICGATGLDAEAAPGEAPRAEAEAPEDDPYRGGANVQRRRRRRSEARSERCPPAGGSRRGVEGSLEAVGRGDDDEASTGAAARRRGRLRRGHVRDETVRDEEGATHEGEGAGWHAGERVSRFSREKTSLEFVHGGHPLEREAPLSREILESVSPRELISHCRGLSRGSVPYWSPVTETSLRSRTT